MKSTVTFNAEVTYVVDKEVPEDARNPKEVAEAIKERLLADDILIENLKVFEGADEDAPR